MITTHHVDLPDHTPATVKANWSYNYGTPGTLSDARGWELIEWWIIGHPHATPQEREYVRKQIEERPPSIYHDL